MKNGFIILIFLFSATRAFNQNQTANRLTQKYASARHDTSRIAILDSLSMYYLYFTTEQDSALQFINQAINYALPLKDKKYLILAYSRLALYLWLTAKYQSSIEITFKGIKLSKEYNIPYYYSALYYNLCGTYFQISDFKQMQKNAILAAYYLKYVKDPFFDQSAKNTSLLGFSYGLNGDYDSAFYYLNKGLTLSQTSHDQTSIDANRFFMGYIYYSLKDYDKAQIVLEAGREHCKQINDYEWLENFPYMLALIHLNKNNITKAIATAHLAINYAHLIKDKKFIALSAHTLSGCYEKKGVSDSALYYLKLSNQINDEIANSDINKQIQQTEFSEQLNQKEEQSRQELEKERIRNQVSLYVFITALAFFLLIAMIQWHNNKLRKKANILLQLQKKEIQSALNNLKLTQSQLIQSEKMASLGELTAGIAHEIQNPLNFVNNFSEVNAELIEELKGERSKAKSERDDELEDELLNDIAENEQKINLHGKRADAIVKGMLQHSRVSGGKKEPTDINALADEYLRLSYHGLRAKDKSFNATIETHFDESIGKIEVVPQDIGRVLLNLFNNAFYAVKPPNPLKGEHYDPKVTVTTKRVSSPSGAGGLEIRVRDNGVGIPQKIVDKIFQPFFTTKPTGKGTGLGLSLSYDIIKAHGGEIKVASKEGEGTEFLVRLPAGNN